VRASAGRHEFGGRITLRGGGVNEEYYPSCSPSGAFLDGVD